MSQPNSAAVKKPKEESFYDRTKRVAAEKAATAKRLAKKAGAKAYDAAEDLGEAAHKAGDKAYHAAEDLSEAALETDAGKKASALATSGAAHVSATAHQVAQSEMGQQVAQRTSDVSRKVGQKTSEMATLAKKRADSAKKEGKKRINDAKEKMRKIIIEKAVVVAGRGIDNAVDGVATSMGKDPFMPHIIIQAVDSVVDDIRDDAKIFVRENIEDMFEKQDKETKAKISATYAPCCKRIVNNDEDNYDASKQTYTCNPWFWLRATILYTMAPNDRSFWWQMYQPMFWLLTVISIFPAYGISQIWWVFLFFLRDFRDEFQLVEFMVKVKTTAVLAVGLIPSYIGISTYLSCVEKGK